MLDLAFLTKSGGFILKPISILLGWILNAIYEFLTIFSQNGIANIALCIVLFTIIAKMLMLPLTIKQQKSTKLSTKMNPELQAIQAKYKGKTDQVSQMKMRTETQAVYDKYGSNPMVGCLMLLISLPIMFALYRVIYAIPAYINDVYDMYEKAATAIRGVDGYVPMLSEFVKDAGLKAVNLSSFGEYESGVLTLNHVIDVLAKCNESGWQVLAQSFPSISSVLTECSEPIIEVHGFVGGLNILNNPVMNKNYFTPGILIPILAVATNIIQTKFNGMKMQKDANGNDAMGSSMKMMNVFMPIMSGVICFMVPIGVGIYWIIGAVVQTVQQIFINRYMEKISVEDLMAKGQAKRAKRREKMGIVTGNRMSEVARTATKTIDVQEVKTTTDYARVSVKKDNDVIDGTATEVNESSEETTPKSETSNSIASYANIMKNRNNK